MFITIRHFYKRDILGIFPSSVLCVLPRQKDTIKILKKEYLVHCITFDLDEMCINVDVSDD